MPGPWGTIARGSRRQDQGHHHSRGRGEYQCACAAFAQSTLVSGDRKLNARAEPVPGADRERADGAPGGARGGGGRGAGRGVRRGRRRVGRARAARGGAVAGGRTARRLAGNEPPGTYVGARPFPVPIPSLSSSFPVSHFPMSSLPAPVAGRASRPQRPLTPRRVLIVTDLGARCRTRRRGCGLRARTGRRGSCRRRRAGRCRSISCERGRRSWRRRALVGWGRRTEGGELG